MSRALCRLFLAIALLACLPSEGVHADPIHPVADGAYWHHGSNWTFPQTIERYERVGIPQDVAGSDDAVAHYAYVEDGVRYVASVNVYRASSAAASELEGAAPGLLSSDGVFVVKPNALTGIRRIYGGHGGESALTGVYVINAGEWRVTIQVSGSRLEAMDAFVRAQRWETLGAH
jgi:hypothetical protein